MKSKTGNAGRVNILSSELLLRGRVWEIRRDTLEEPGGIKATREIIVHPGSVVVLPVFPDGRILMIRQYRHAAGQYLWELVAGHKEPNETFVEGGHRELREEAGYTARKLTKLLDIYPSPGLLGEIMEIYLAEGLTKVQSSLQRMTKKITSAWSRWMKPCAGFAPARSSIRSQFRAFCTTPTSSHGRNRHPHGK